MRKDLFCIYEAMVDNGYVLIARNIMYSEIWKKKPEYLKIWIYLLVHVNHKKNKVFPRGSNFFNVPEISKETGIKVNTVYNSIEWLKKAKQITTQKTTRGIVVNVLQYETYQDPANYKGETKGETKGEISTKQVRNGYDTINNNEKNDNKENKETLVVKTTTHPMVLFRDSVESQDTNFEQYSKNIADKKNTSQDTVKEELKKFVNYWTQKNPSGKKELWEMQKVFDLPKRLNTWFGNVKPPGKVPQDRPSFFKL